MPDKETQMEQSLKQWQEEIYGWAKSKGWWDNPNREVGTVLALIHSEISEALEEWRDGRPLTEIYTDEKGKPCGFPIELADTVIRIVDLCEAKGIDLEAAMRVKQAYNETRPNRHGGKLA
jgi:NTP pyrophosphatase (non-canonical NTP hydrolase)